MSNIFKDGLLFAGGVLVGAAAVALFTTPKGEEMRNKMAEAADEARKRAHDYCEQIKQDQAEANAANEANAQQVTTD